MSIVRIRSFATNMLQNCLKRPDKMGPVYLRDYQDKVIRGQSRVVYGIVMVVLISALAVALLVVIIG